MSASLRFIDVGDHAGAILLGSHDRRLVEAVSARRWRLGDAA